MIIKKFELDKLTSLSSNFVLLYGENEGLKKDIINKYFLRNFKNKLEKFDENEIISNYDNFISSLLNKSFFDEKRCILISRLSEKITKLIENLDQRDLGDTLLIFNSNALDKKSKLRNYFENDKNKICIPVYADDVKDLTILANLFFKERKIPVSREIINIIVDRAAGDRQNLNNELEKISIFSYGKSKISSEEVNSLTNLAENYGVSELVDQCLSKNLVKTTKILNENNFSNEDCILIIRTFLSKSKRLLKLKKNFEECNNLEKTISSFKPPIFWKDKNLVQNQILKWSTKNAENLISEINDTELLIKKNSDNSINILADFIFSTANQSSN